MTRIIFSIMVFTSWIVLALTEGLKHTSFIKPSPSYRAPKNIAFLTQGGGNSHHYWVFEIMEELHKRGHNVSFHSTGDQTRFSTDYPMIQTSELGGYESFLAEMTKMNIMNHPKQHEMTANLFTFSMKSYQTVFPKIQKMYTEKHIDVVICDSFYIACADAAMLMKIPVVMTSTFLLYPDAMQSFIYSKISVTVDPSTKDDTIFKKLFKKIYVPFYIWKNTRTLKDVFAFQKALGFKPAISASADRFRKIKKLVNNVYGLEPARETSQLINMIGPIMKKSYPPLDQNTLEFLKQHNRIVYVAFGQHMVASKSDIEMILPNLLRLKYEGHIDGIIWPNFNYSLSSENSKTPINESYVTLAQQELKNDPCFLTMKWASQFGILQHSSTKLFISHSGTSSLLESFYNGVKVFSYPFFGDQPINSRMVQRLRIGDFMDAAYLTNSKKEREVLYDKLLHLLTDKDGKISDHVKRFSNYLQIHAENGVTKGANLVEESLFSSDDQGYLFHRQDLKHEINWLRRHDVDMYSAIVIFFALAYLLIHRILKYSSYVTIKVKVD